MSAHLFFAKKKPFIHQSLAKHDAVIRVEPQQCNSSLSDLRIRSQVGPIPKEMIVPCISAWIKETNQFICTRQIRRDIASLEIIATRAGPSQVGPWCLRARMWSAS